MLRCIEHDHWFEVTPDNHLNNTVGCPKCITTGYSRKQIGYFEYITNRDNIYIQHKLNGGEYQIKGTGKVDGYCEATNTVYEFHGDFWHGNPAIYNPLDTNPFTKKLYDELYKKTKIRDQKIIDAGYNLVVIWESEWNAIKKENKKLLKSKITV